jgi:predicted transcriptional regulator
MDKNTNTLGDQELEVLRFVADRAPITVREVADDWGKPRGLARTTILTVMERLREKNYLVRDKDDSGSGSWRYSPAMEKGELLRGLVRDFVQKTLGGSLSPFVAYLADAADTRDISDKEMEELKRIVGDLEK